MKVTLEFNLPEDQDDLDMALKGRDMFCVIWEILEGHIRTRLKYENPSEDVSKELEVIRKKIVDEINERQLPGFF